VFQIGDFARLGKVSVRTLRFYDEIGLLRPARVDATTGYRRYSLEQVPLLNRILAFRDLGFSLPQIARLADPGTPLPTRRALLLERRADLRSRACRELERLALVNSRLRRMERLAEGVQHEVSLRRTEPAWVASLREELPSYEAMDRLFDTIGEELGDGRLVRGRAAIWHRCASRGEPIDCEALLFLKRPAPRVRRVRIARLPAATMACLFHRGGDETIGEAYRSLRHWISSNGFRVAGPNREIYWADDASDPESRVMEIQFPVETPRRGVDPRRSAA
jgi:DNA-binding transcriptional MerR regulator